MLRDSNELANKMLARLALTLQKKWKIGPKTQNNKGKSAANKKQKKQGKGGGLMGRDCFVAESKYPLETPVDEREGVRGNNSPCTPPFGAVFA